MADEREDTTPVVENDDTSTDTSTDEDLTAADEAEIEAGASDTVPRSEMIKAIKGRQAAKAALRAKEQELKELQQKNESDSEKAVREAEERAAKAVTDRYKPALVRTGATAAILGAGPKNGKAGVNRLIKLMNLDAIDVTDDFELEGVEDEVARLVEEYPELFGEEPTEGKPAAEKKPAARKPAATSKSQDGADKKPAEKKMTTSEVLMKKLRGEM